MKNYRSISLLFLSLIIITCSKESDVASDAYSSSASQNTYIPPSTTTTTVTQFTLAVTAAEGGGVSSTGGTYDDGTSVSITATPTEGYEFVGWNGTDMSSSTITITLTANTTIEALFSQVSTTTTVTQFTLAVSASNGGTVSTEGGDFEEGTEVTITATANAGYRFTGWEGSDSTSESLTVTLNSDQTYQALFELVPVSVSVYTISVTAQGSANYILSGDDANGYKAVTFHNVGNNFPVFEDVKKHVVDTGKAAGAGDQIGTAIYNRGFYAAMLAAEAVRNAQAIHGVSDITPAMMLDGMESLEITEARMAELGMPNFGPSFKVSCENHGGPGTVGVAQWDASSKTWSLISDFKETDMSVIQPLIEADSAAFAAENNIAERCN